MHKAFLKLIEELLEKNPEKAKDIDVKDVLTEVTPSITKTIKDSLMNSAEEMLNQRHRRHERFRKRNIKRWKEGFDALETLIVICSEAGEEFNHSYRPTAARKNDLVFDLVVRHHARACHIAQEILSLLKSGYADAAHARWRALHEVNATSMFIAKHGKECAERFYFHDVVDSYDGMHEHKKYEDRLQEKAPSDDEIAACKTQYDALLKKYGNKFSDYYGWAAHIFPGQKRVGFGAIEKDVGLDHMRPYYKWASLNIHAGSKGMRNRLGLCEAKEDILLVGPSNSGMTDPAHATAISLCQATITLLKLNPTLDHIVLMNLTSELEEEVGQVFLGISGEAGGDAIASKKVDKRRRAIKRKS
jgi:hypothetical protein